jgi:hypothetical protein
MHRFAKFLGSAGLLLATALNAGCGNSASGLTTGAATDAPAVKAEDPMARPVQVAWTSARATRCGFYFDAAKLRTNYLAYEARQGAAGEQLSKIEKTYDSTLKTISSRIAGEADYCSDKKGADIKADLQRHLAGDFTPNLPKAKEVATCGFFGCKSSSDEKFDSGKFWKSENDKLRR